MGCCATEWFRGENRLFSPTTIGSKAAPRCDADLLARGRSLASHSSSAAGKPTLGEMTQTRHLGTWFIAVVAMALALVVAGCGDDSEGDGTSDMKAVAKVMTDLNTASRAGDGERICSQLFTPKLANSVSTSSSSGECATR